MPRVSLHARPTEIMLALTLSSSAFVAPLTPAGRNGVAISMIGGRDGQVNAGGNGKWAPAWKTRPFTAEGAASLQPPVQVESNEPAAAPAAAASAAGATTVVQAMKFMQDPTLAGISLVEDEVARPAGLSGGLFQRQSCLRLPGASASLGSSAAWAALAALAGYIGLAFDMTRHVGRGQGQIPRVQRGGCVRDRAGQLRLARRVRRLRPRHVGSLQVSRGGGCRGFARRVERVTAWAGP